VRGLVEHVAGARVGVPGAVAEAVLVGAGAGPSPLRSRVTRQAAVLKVGCLETGSHTVIVSSLAERWSASVRSSGSQCP
jgi:hypothetical protein